ncbi:MAG TPA: NADH-quinone oxidoreductase subunit J [Verrucomicrobiae bacterium]|jgi:NADH-quinone oxidoreductase subunit J|nr:NADH-quinone oxidoreductase subunit J [Verrucomicrobiae bacterium]
MPSSFYILALFTIASGFFAMSLRNLVHCALCLALSFLGVAGLFLHLNAGFIAFAQILVYVGAVAILIVFAILLTHNTEEKKGESATNLVLSIPLSAAVAAILLNGAFSTQLALRGTGNTAPSVRELGTALMTSYVVPLEIIGVLLTVALLGAIVLALPERSSPPEAG